MCSPSGGGGQSGSDLAEKTFVDYSWRLEYLERFFGRYRLSEITPRWSTASAMSSLEQAQTIRMRERAGPRR